MIVGLGDLGIGVEVRAQLLAVTREASADEDREFRRLLPGAAAKARAIAAHWDFMGPARVIDDFILDILDSVAFAKAKDSSSNARLRRVAVARLILDFFEIQDRLPPSVIGLYPAFVARLAKFVTEKATDGYDEDYFAKDVRYALGVTVPCGALQIDLEASVGPKLILHDAIATRSVRSVLAYTVSGGWGRWYSNHLDLRAMKEFTPAGWSASFAMLAEILDLNPRIRGIAGVSWFYDPKVADVSPQLAYILHTPMRHGAFLAHMGTDSHHIRNATVRSPIRKKAYEEGRYLPTCYLLAWPRRPLLEWAQRLRADPSVGFAGPQPATPPRRNVLMFRKVSRREIGRNPRSTRENELPARQL